MGGERELLLARAAENLFTASDERVLIESAIELLAESFGYGLRYVLLYDPTHGDLYFHAGKGPRAEEARTSDVIARVGGDEFAVIQPETDVSGGVIAAERICETIRRTPFATIAGESQPTTVSIGVSGVPQHARTSADLFRLADAALYESKRAGKDRMTVATAVVPA